MSSIVIAGDTSGSVTLQAPAVAGTTTLTLPATSGTLALTSAASQWTTTGANIYYNTGNVGIGTSSPTDNLSVGTSSGATQLKIQSGSGINNCILHTNGTTDSWRIGMNLSFTNGSYEFYDDINNVTRALIPSTGGIQSQTTISVGAATPSTSGAGITFPATQSASTNANTLDDYEEGTWTPIVNAQSQTGITCQYTKIGKMVQISGDATFSFTGTSNAEVSGLPFTTQSASQSAITIAYTTGGTLTGFLVTSSSTTMVLYNQSTTTTFTTGQRFIFTGTYIAAN